MDPIALIDYGSGNLRSVSKALEAVGAEVRLVDSPAALDVAAAVVLPGVGSFGDCVKNLRGTGLWEPVKEWLAEDRPFLGICLGYQLLFEESEESPGVAGLGHFRGKVRRFQSPDLKIPHMGWNSLHLSENPLWKGLEDSPYVFFVHSYFPDPDDPSIVAATTDYGEPFAASASRGQVFATQFHPEKSQAVGLRILRNFVESFS